MIRMSRLTPALVAVVLLAACAGPQSYEPKADDSPSTGSPSPTPQSVAVDTGVDLPPALQTDSDALLEAGQGAAWQGGDRTAFVVVVFGSSTCVPIPTELSVADPQTLLLEFTQSPNDPCTADMSPNTFLFDTPEGISPDGDIALTITSEAGGTSKESTVPILE